MVRESLRFRFEDESSEVLASPPESTQFLETILETMRSNFLPAS